MILEKIIMRIVAILALLFTTAPYALAEGPPPIVDTHAHIVNAGGGRRGPDFHAALDAAIRVMDRAGIRRAIVMPPPLPSAAAGYEIESLRFARETYGGRILPGGGGGSLNGMIHATAPDAVTEENKNAFRGRAQEITAAGAVVFGEIALH